MELTLINTALKREKTLDTFLSLIWTDRYCGFGDFELMLSTKLESPDEDKRITELVKVISLGKYLALETSEHTMIIESYQIKTDIEDGNRLIIKGRSLESILDRRIVWTSTILSGNLQTEMQRLLNENAINPVDVTRKINNLVFESSVDPAITSLTVNTQFTGDNLYDAILHLCMVNDIGFKITLSDSGNFVFKLYSGKDRSYNQDANPWVVFSPDNDNLLNSDYLESSKIHKTVTLVGGEGEGLERTFISVAYEDEAGSDLARRELFTDARGVTRNVEGGMLTEEEYINLLAQKGAEELAKCPFIKTFDGEADASQMFIYGEDFEMGDIVQITNEYGHESTSRIIELIHTQDETGIGVYPTFSDPL